MLKETKELITPKMAERYLNANTVNRVLTEGHAEIMAADMTAKTWTHCLAPIVFYEGGALADGQHRLWAIILSGTAQRFTVIRGLPLAEGRNIDIGKVRTPVDVMRIQGIDPEASLPLAAIARGIEDGTPSSSKRRRTMTDHLMIMAKHREASHWAYKNGPRGRGLCSAPVMSAIGRAYYVEQEKERLAHFGKVLSKGFVESNDDSAAVAMRNYLQAKAASRILVSSTSMWRDTFLKAQNAIYNFMRHKPITMIRAVADESYPLAERLATTAPQTKIGARRFSKVKTAAKRGKKKAA